jgi:hypothetical protein
MTKGPRHDAGRHCDIANENEWQIPVERGVDRVVRAGPDEGVTVGRRPHDGLGGDIAPGAGPVIDDDRLAHSLLKRLRNQSRRDIAAAAGRKSVHDVDRSGGKRFSFRKMRGDWQCCGPAGKVQKSAARKAHLAAHDTTCKRNGIPV